VGTSLARAFIIGRSSATVTTGFAIPADWRRIGPAISTADRDHLAIRR
jgi:hypothetical protein